MSLFLIFPYTVWDCWWLAPLALVLDLWLGDPALPWRHPVCVVGRLLDMLEVPARRFMDSGSPEGNRLCGRLAGTVVLITLVGAVGLVVWAAVSLPALGPFAALYLAWAGLAMGSLLSTGREVLRRVETFDAPAARMALSWLVSRETAQMDRPLMRKTLADTLAENLTDAFMAPFFWLLVGGPVALWCYKAISTMDSMWGYMTEKWRWLGWAGARCDDALAFFPARIAICAVWFTDVLARAGRNARVICGTRFAGKPFPFPLRVWPLRAWCGCWPGLRCVARQAAGMPSPNSGWSMAACAWLCGARMAGPSVYFGVLVPKPWLGPEPEKAGSWDAERLSALCELLRQVSLYGGLALWLICSVLAGFAD